MAPPPGIDADVNSDRSEACSKLRATVVQQARLLLLRAGVGEHRVLGTALPMDIFTQYFEDWRMNTELVGWLNPADHEALVAQPAYCMGIDDSGTFEFLQITETGEIIAVRQIVGHTVESTSICAGGSRAGIDCLRDNLRDIEPSLIPTSRS